MSVLNRIFQLLNRDLTGRTWTEERSHPYFKSLVYFGSKTSGHSYWEGEVTVPSTGESIVATMKCTKQGPSDQEVAFCRWVVSDLDSIFETCRAVIEPEYLKWAKNDLPDDWRSEFKLEGLQVPVGGDKCLDWGITYFVLRAGHWFTISLERGAPVHVSVDG